MAGGLIGRVLTRDSMSESMGLGMRTVTGTSRGLVRDRALSMPLLEWTAEALSMRASALRSMEDFGGFASAISLPSLVQKYSFWSQKYYF